MVQPNGASFAIDDGNRITWEGWTLRVGFTSREGACLQTVKTHARTAPTRVGRVWARASLAKGVRIKKKAT